MCVSLVKADYKDADILAGISAKAFDDEINYGAPLVKSGPPGYDDPEWQIDIMNKGGIYYLVKMQDIVVGGVVIFFSPPDPFYLKRLFILPEFQNQGIGTRVIQLLRDLYPDADHWFCATPAWNLRTIHFYLKNGFSNTGIIKDQFHHFDLVRLEIETKKA